MGGVEGEGGGGGGVGVGRIQNGCTLQNGRNRRVTSCDDPGPDVPRVNFGAPHHPQG